MAIHQAYELYQQPADFDKIPTIVIVEIYNTATGKSIKGFHTRTKGIEQTLAALAAKRPADFVTREQKVTAGVAALKRDAAAGKDGMHTVRPQSDGCAAMAMEEADRRAAAPKKPRGQGRTKHQSAAVIRVQAPANPKRPGTLAYDQFRVLMACDGKPVQAFLDQEGQNPTLDKRSGWPRVELAYCVRARLVKLEVPATVARETEKGTA